MALTEQTVQTQVTINTTPGFPSTINVKWERQIIDDTGIVVTVIPKRKAYGIDQKNEFLLEVTGADTYILAAGW